MTVYEYVNGMTKYCYSHDGEDINFTIIDSRYKDIVLYIYKTKKNQGWYAESLNSNIDEFTKMLDVVKMDGFEVIVNLSDVFIDRFKFNKFGSIHRNKYEEEKVFIQRIMRKLCMHEENDWRNFINCIKHREEY